MRISAFIILVTVVVGTECTPDQDKPKGVIYDSLAPYRDSIEAANNRTDTVRISDINSYNQECSLIEDTMQFRWPIHLAKNDLGFVRVRSDASCFDADSCFHNLIGTIPHDQWVWSYGKVKYKYWSAGLAWVICVRDSKGRLVKGYISETVVDQD